MAIKRKKEKKRKPSAVREVSENLASAIYITFNKRAALLAGSTSGRPGVSRAPDPGRCNRVAVERAEAAG